MGKFHPYENDIRVPALIRGPGIVPGSVREDILGTHVDIMPTLLGLAASAVGDDDHIPSTMDGQNLAWELLLAGSYASDRRRRTSILVEYIGLKEVLRKFRWPRWYSLRTLTDTATFTFSQPRSAPIIVPGYRHLVDSYNNTFRALRVIDDTQPVGRRNIKYVEFTDCEKDWNFTQAPMELELFDLDADPYELINIAASADSDFITSLRDATHRLFTCSGKSCRDVWKASEKAATTTTE